MTSVTIGIDFGTTNSLAAIYRQVVPEVIANNNTERYTPSVVFFDPKNLKVQVGTHAEDGKRRCPRNCISEIKRLIGRSFADAYVQSKVLEAEKNVHLNKIVRGEDQLPYIDLEVTDTDAPVNRVSPEDVCREILGYVTQSVRDCHKNAQTVNAVISVPAYFSYPQRAAIKRAAENANIKVLQLITEPVAAAIYYVNTFFDEFQGTKQLMVIDLGGGTLDLSIVECSDEQFKVQAIEGDNFLGGTDFDELLLEKLKRQLKLRYNYENNLKSSREIILHHRLKRMAVKIKHALSLQESCTKYIDWVTESDSFFEVTLTRKEFEDVAKPLFQRILHKVGKCLDSIKMSPSDIDKTILVGGCSRIPKIREDLTKFFNGREPSRVVSPEEVVALGAAIHATSRNRYQVNDIAPYCLGLRSQYDLMIRFIEKGASLPASYKTRMSTTYNNQEIIKIEVFQGDRMQCTYNQKLGVLVIDDIPQKPAGEVVFDITYNLDKDGILTIEALDIVTGKEHTFPEISIDQLALCYSEIFMTPEQEEEITKNDEMWNKFYQLRIEADVYRNRVLFCVNHKTLKDRKDALMRALHEFDEKTSPLSVRDEVSLRKRFEELKASTQPLMNSQTKSD